jgi:excisionase family DNA binding protein
VNWAKMSADELLTVQLVAKELGVHGDTVRKWIREKQLKAVSPGREEVIVSAGQRWTSS